MKFIAKILVRTAIHFVRCAHWCLGSDQKLTDKLTLSECNRFKERHPPKANEVTE